MSIRVIFAEDQPLIREGVRGAIRRSRTMKIVGEAGNGREVLVLARKYRGAVYLLDLSMPGLNALQTARRLLARDPTAKIIFLSPHRGRSFLVKAFQAGVRGYLAKDSAPDEVREAIAWVSAGEYYLRPPGGARAAARICGWRDESGFVRKPVTLTRRQQVVLQFIAKGWHSREIAAKLKLSIHTVEAHRGNLMTKLGLHNKADLLRYARRKG